MNCTLIPANDDASILNKMMVFRISTPDEDTVMYGAKQHYCISHVKSHFDEDSLAALESEAIDDFTKKIIKIQYMKICSFAFMFGIGKDCVRDKYNRLIPIDLTAQNQRNILENNNGTYSPSLVSEITNDIYAHLNKLEEDYDLITSNQKWELINKYKDQLDQDHLFREKPKFGTCCCCGSPCNPCSQTCGACPRNGRLMAWGLGYRQ